LAFGPAAGSRGQELEFLPAALEIVETPASPVGRAVAHTICIFFALALAWSCWGEVDVVAAATGRIIPSGRTKTIQPLEIGVVRAIHVSEGQAVRTGEPLVELDSTTSVA
jgi:hemolysin D